VMGSELGSNSTRFLRYHCVGPICCVQLSNSRPHNKFLAGTLWKKPDIFLTEVVTSAGKDRKGEQYIGSEFKFMSCSEVMEYTFSA
jgi:hypothetical protein